MSNEMEFWNETLEIKETLWVAEIQFTKWSELSNFKEIFKMTMNLQNENLHE